MILQQRLIGSLLHLIYPKLCIACQRQVTKQNQAICLGCHRKLELSDFHEQAENQVTELFWGRLPLFRATAMFPFMKGGRVQSLIHRLKYENQPEIGQLLGEWYGQLLAQQPDYRDVDLILPMPLHPKKAYKRGYNQAAKFAQGLAQGLNSTWSEAVVKRVQNNASQTKKSRLQRFANVEKAFQVVQPKLLPHKHVLLVDDVITTGATMEACARALLEAGHFRLSLCAIALAQ